MWPLNILMKKKLTHTRFSSIENKKVKVSIVKEVLQQPDCKFSELEIGGECYILISTLTLYH